MFGRLRTIDDREPMATAGQCASEEQGQATQASASIEISSGHPWDMAHERSVEMGCESDAER